MNNLVKGWDRVCFGSRVGAALGVASFFAVEAFAPSGASDTPAVIGGEVAPAIVRTTNSANRPTPIAQYLVGPLSSGLTFSASDKWVFNPPGRP